MEVASRLQVDVKMLDLLKSLLAQVRIVPIIATES